MRENLATNANNDKDVVLVSKTGKQPKQTEKYHEKDIHCQYYISLQLVADIINVEACKSNEKWNQSQGARWMLPRIQSIKMLIICCSFMFLSVFAAVSMRPLLAPKRITALRVIS